MQFTPELIVLSVISAVSLVISLIAIVSLRKVTKHYNSLTKGIEQKTLMNVLQGIQQSLSQHEKQLGATQTELKEQESKAVRHVQNVVLKRFNPFGDTGGDQSFILALLDGKKDGIVITSLHSRENTRFYVKSVSGGVGIDHPLSNEEDQIINRKAK